MTTEPAPDTEQEPAAEEQSVEDLLAAAKAEADKWKALSRKNEETAKANAAAAAKLKEIELAGKSEEEKHRIELEEARAEAHRAKVEALKLRIAGDKGLPPTLAKFLPDVDTEIDMINAADELLAAAGVPPTPNEPFGQPKSGLTNPLTDKDPAAEREALIAAMSGN